MAAGRRASLLTPSSTNERSFFGGVVDVGAVFGEHDDYVCGVAGELELGVVDGIDDGHDFGGAVDYEYEHGDVVECDDVGERDVAIDGLRGVRRAVAAVAEGASTSSSSALQTPVPLSAFAHFVPTSEPLSINHKGQFPAVTISFNLNTGYSLGEALDAINKVIDEGQAADERGRELPGNGGGVREFALE